MSDNDDDDRLDRAKRIRRMREGGQSDEQDGDASDQSADDGASDDADETTDATEDGSTASDDADSESTDGSESTDEPETDTGEDLETESDPVEDDTESDAEPADENDHAEPETPDVEGADLEEEAAATEELGVDTDEENISAPLPEADELEEALESADAESEADGVAPEEVADTEAATPGEVMEDESEYEEDTRVLEFALEDEHYCLDIEYIEEIVKEETITRVPNTPDFVEGVVDLRGQITTIINPKVTIGKDNTDPGDLIIVFDSDSFEDQGHIGWVVDDVRQVSPITDSDVNDPPIEEDYINGVIDREDDEQFVIWTTPDMALDEAESA